MAARWSSGGPGSERQRAEVLVDPEGTPAVAGLVHPVAVHAEPAAPVAPDPPGAIAVVPVGVVGVASRVVGAGAVVAAAKDGWAGATAAVGARAVVWLRLWLLRFEVVEDGAEDGAMIIGSQRGLDVIIHG